MDEKKIVAKSQGELQVVEKVSNKTGKTYYAIEFVVNGKVVQIGFVSAYVECSLQRAGIKFNY